jgi:D-psicose/D-tagatose/L-ribulose 3-epimerase
MRDRTMIKFAICNETFGDWPFERVCEVVSRAGYEGVELAPFTFAADVRELSSADRTRIQETARAAGLEIAGLHWLMVSPPGLHINSPDAGVRAKTTEYLRSLVHFCADVGGTIMVFGSPKQRWVEEDADREAAWERTRTAYQAITPDLAERGVTLCMESLPGPESNFITSAAEAARMVADVSHPNFQLMLDVKSMIGEGRVPADVIREFHPIIRHFHANDANRRGPGFGETDFRPIAAALKECGYDGYVSVEVFDYTPDPETIAERSIEHLRKVFS